MLLEPTVFVVDDDPAGRESVIALVESMGLAARGFGSAADFLSAYANPTPGCLVTDVRMLGMSGLELQQRMLVEGITLPVIVTTAYADVRLTVRAMQNGAVTLLEKPCREQELWDAIQKALAVDRENREKLERRRDVERRINSLTPEESQVMEMMLAGELNKVIAAQLDIGVRTVELRRHNVMRKMQAESIADLVRLMMLVRG
jgi:FixJ family two-component response regulator